MAAYLAPPNGGQSNPRQPAYLTCAFLVRTGGTGRTKPAASRRSGDRGADAENIVFRRTPA